MAAAPPFAPETSTRGERDPVLGIRYLSEAYLAADPAYTARVTVPALVDTRTGRLVSNDFAQLTCSPVRRHFSIGTVLTPPTTTIYDRRPSCR